MQLTVGYEVDFPNDLYEQGSHDNVVQNSKGETVDVQWMGLRTNFGLIYSF